MFAKLLPFELNLQFKQLGFWITIIIVFLASLAFGSLDVGTSGERIKSNGALAVAVFTSAFSLFAIFFGAIYVVSGVMRDQVSKSLEVIHATPVPTSAMIMARFFGAFAATFASLLAMVFGVFVVQFAPWTDAETLGPLNLWYYIYPALLFVGINALLVTAIFTTVATVTRDRTLVYVSAVALFILYNITTFAISDDTPKLLVALLDPFGAAALAQETEFWPAAEQNTRLIPLGNYVGVNRLIWSLVSIALFAYSFFGFQRGMGRSNKTKRGGVVPSSLQSEIELHQLKAPLGGNNLPVLWTRIKFEYMSTVKSVAFMILSGLVLAMTGLIIMVRNQVTPDPTLPTNAAMAQFALIGTFIPLMLITIFFAGEIVWRDRAHRVTELIDSTPALNWPFMAGKWIAMFGVVLTIVAGGMFIGILAQLFLGDVGLNFGTHFANAFIDFAPRVLFFAALVMFIQNFMPNRVVGMVVGGVIVAAILFGVQFLPFYHPMMNFGSTPNGGFSEMNGFATMGRFLWFLVYWTGLAGLFAVSSIWLWRRGLQTSLVRRFKSISSQLSAMTGALAAVSVIAFVGAGWTIYKGYNIENDYQTRNEREAEQARLERELGDKLFTQLPKIQDVSVDVQFYPSRQAVDAKGTYTIENTTDEALSTLYMTIAAPNEAIKTLTLSGATQSLETEAEQRHAENNGIRLYRFDQPLQPGDETTLTFDFSYPAPTLGGTQLVRNNGTFVNNSQLMPVLGISDLRIRNPDRRRKNDLPPLEEMPERTYKIARQTHFLDWASDYVTYKATVCTDAGQIPLAPGTIVEETETDGRVCRTYVPNRPITNFAAYVSADYKEAKDVWTGPDGRLVELTILYDAQHDYNISLMIQAMKDSLDVYTETFGPYQYDTMRIMEFPYATFAQSFAGTIPFSENIGFVIDPGNPDDNDSVDLATYVTMHEIGHQWFGHQILPATTQGYNILSEGLTENAALTAYEKTYGWQKARRLLQQRSIQAYLTRRTLDSSTEKPLALARADQQYLVYNKANWVFWGLKQYIGEANMQTAIRAFLEEYGETGPPYPTTLELVAYLREAAGPDYQQLVTDYWDRIVFWELGLGDTSPTIQAKGDAFEVSLTLTVDKKIASEETGKELSVTEAEFAKPEDDSDDEQGDLIRAAESLDEWVEIGFYAEDPADTFGDEWIQLERIRVSEMETTHTFTLDERPNYVLVDPRRLLIERNVGDNKFRFPAPDKS